MFVGCHPVRHFSVPNMQEVSTLVTVQGIEFNPSLDRVFFDFDGVLHTSTQGVRSKMGSSRTKRCTMPNIGSWNLISG